MLSAILLGLLLVATALGAIASRARFSPWWTFVPAAVAAAVALATSSDVSTCDARDSTEALFGIATLFAIGLFATAALTALFDAVRFARRGEAGLAVRRVAPLILGAGLAFGTFVLWLYTVLSCLA
jgi:hypothetical protein